MEKMAALSLLLFVVLAVNGESECPKEKTVGNICYELVEKGVDTSQYECQDGCVYTTGSGQDRVCFKKGGLPVLDTCPAKNQTQDNLNERFNVLETTSEVLLDMAKNNLYQPRSKENIMVNCHNECLTNKGITSFEDYQKCYPACITENGPNGPPFPVQTEACKEANTPLIGRCIEANSVIPPKVVKLKNKCEGTAECAVYRWKCNITSDNEACTQKMIENPTYEGKTAYKAACFPGKAHTFFYFDTPYTVNQKFPGVCRAANNFKQVNEGLFRNSCGCVGRTSCTFDPAECCQCDCTCLVFYR